MTDHEISEKQYLQQYNIHDFDVPLATVDMAIFTVRDGQLKILLTKRAQHPEKGKWALPGGFIDLAKDQTLDGAAARKLAEKTSVTTPYLEQVCTVGSRSRDPRGWSLTVTYFALISSDEMALAADSASSEISWLPVNKLKSYSVAFDHKQLIKICYERLHSKVQYTAIPLYVMPQVFTLTELQQVYELLLEKDLEKKAFRRRILEAGVLEETGEMRRGSSRPAKLYRLQSSAAEHLFTRNLQGVRG